MAEKDPDGVTRIKFLVDADIFAVLGRNGDKRAPFVIKDGVVYMNKLLLDDAEIGSVISKYIKVDHLVGTTIEGATIKGGVVVVGENPNGPWEGFGTRWNAVINTFGDGFFQNLTGRNCNLTGTVNANAGTFNNVTIAENCNVLGTVYANRIVGDVCKTLSFSDGAGSCYFEPYSRTRKIATMAFNVNGGGSIRNVGEGDTAEIYLNILKNGASIGSVRVASVPWTVSNFSFTDQVMSYVANFPPNESATISLNLTTTRGNIQSSVIGLLSPVVCMAFIQ